MTTRSADVPPARSILSRYGGAFPEHFRLSPSASSRWLNCPGSARADLPESLNAAALEGRAAHAVAAEALQLGTELAGGLLSAYTRYALSLPGELFVERQFASETIFDLGGTIDALAVTDTTLHVVDLKTGKWPVAASANPQLAIYLLLAREAFPGRQRFLGTIVQQKDPLIDTATFSAQQLDGLRQTIINASVRADRIGGTWCRFCPLKPTCPEYHQFNRRQQR